MTTLSDFDEFITAATEAGDGPGGAAQTIFEFDNGYGASVIRGGSNAYGGLEMAVLNRDGGLTYDTSVTDDVLGYLTDNSLAGYLQEVQDLPEAPEASWADLDEASWPDNISFDSSSD